MYVCVCMHAYIHMHVRPSLVHAYYYHYYLQDSQGLLMVDIIIDYQLTELHRHYLCCVLRLKGRQGSRTSSSSSALGFAAAAAATSVAV